MSVACDNSATSILAGCNVYYVLGTCLIAWCDGLSICLVLSEIDECATGVHNCDGNALCTNTPGSFQCTCIINYSGDGVTCSGKSQHITYTTTLTH